MNLKRIIAAGAFALMSAAGAQAADIPAPIAVTPPAPPPPPAPMAPAFDWSGPYVGAYGGYIVIGGAGIQAGVQAGFNMVRGSFLAGIEGQVGAIFTGGTTVFEADVNARLGFILGERVLLYGEAGVMYITSAGAFFWTAGGGLEIGLGAAASLFAEGKVIGAFGGGCCGYVVQGGLNWHPGN